jgi:callose synthase
MFDKVWAATRGGTSKASAVVNVSEDIFAGFNSALRGGESAHCEFMQVGKGRDVGIVQIEVFESKISGGTAISTTTRDSFRVCEGMDGARLLSFYHTAAGFYVSNVLVVTSLVATVYCESLTVLLCGGPLRRARGDAQHV